MRACFFQKFAADLYSSVVMLFAFLTLGNIAQFVCGEKLDLLSQFFQFEKLEIHTVSLGFSNFNLRQNLSAIALVSLCGVAFTLLLLLFLDFNLAKACRYFYAHGRSSF